MLRLRASQCRPRHPGTAGVARPQKHPAHGALHRTGAGQVQGLLAIGICGDGGAPWPRCNYFSQPTAPVDYPVARFPRFRTALGKPFSALRIDLAGGRKRLPSIKSPQGRNLAPSAAGPLFWGRHVGAPISQRRAGQRKTEIARQYIRTITARDKMLKRASLQGPQYLQ
jgi:hypothetical protein